MPPLDDLSPLEVRHRLDVLLTNIVTLQQTSLLLADIYPQTRTEFITLTRQFYETQQRLRTRRAEVDTDLHVLLSDTLAHLQDIRLTADRELISRLDELVLDQLESW